MSPDRIRGEADELAEGSIAKMSPEQFHFHSLSIPLSVWTSVDPLLRILRHQVLLQVSRVGSRPYVRGSIDFDKNSRKHATSLCFLFRSTIRAACRQGRRYHFFGVSGLIIGVEISFFHQCADASDPDIPELPMIESSRSFGNGSEAGGHV